MFTKQTLKNAPFNGAFFSVCALLENILVSLYPKVVNVSNRFDMKPVFLVIMTGNTVTLLCGNAYFNAQSHARQKDCISFEPIPFPAASGLTATMPISASFSFIL